MMTSMTPYPTVISYVHVCGDTIDRLHLHIRHVYWVMRFCVQYDPNSIHYVTGKVLQKIYQAVTNYVLWSY